MKVAVTGSSGLIGGALVARLRADGHGVVRLVRHAPRGGDEIRWSPGDSALDPGVLDGVDAVVNLAGAGVGDRRWTEAYKQELVSSRVGATRTVVDALLARHGAGESVPVLVNGSAQGFYAERGDEVLDETATAGTGFLAELVQQWEAEALRAEQASDGAVRVCLARTGLVMARTGGAFGKLLPLIKLGLGGPLGSGRQWWSWITLDDEVSALLHLATTAEVRGPVNLCAPNPARNGELVRALAGVARRPALLPAPSFALRAVVGEFSDDILASTRMAPEALRRSGFHWAHPDLDGAALWLLDR